MYELKYIRPTKKELGHTKIFIDEIEIGYFMPIRSKHRDEGNNWFLQLHTGTVKYFTNRTKLIDYLNKRNELDLL